MLKALPTPLLSLRWTSEPPKQQVCPPVPSCCCSPATIEGDTHKGVTPRVLGCDGQAGSYPWVPLGISYIRPLCQDWKRQLIYLLCRNRQRTRQNETGICSNQKNKIKTSEKELNKTEISNLPDRDWKVIIKMLTKLRGGFLGGASGKRTHLPMQEIQETWVWSLGWEDPLEESLATHSSIFAWRIPWTEKPDGL